MIFRLSLFKILVPLCFFVPNLSFAQAKEKSIITQIQMTKNAGTEMSKQAKQLEKIVKQISERVKYSEEARENFTEAQEKWDDFVEAECAFQASHGGTIGRTVYALCKADFIKARIKTLQHYLGCKVGDFSCPLPRR